MKIVLKKVENKQKKIIKMTEVEKVDKPTSTKENNELKVKETLKVDNNA